jgi:Zn-dependent membrane protease YugP
VTSLLSLQSAKVLPLALYNKLYVVLVILYFIFPPFSSIFNPHIFFYSTCIAVIISLLDRPIGLYIELDADKRSLNSLKHMSILDEYEYCVLSRYSMMNRLSKVSENMFYIFILVGLLIFSAAQIVS